jgi:hypothetical protein
LKLLRNVEGERKGKRISNSSPLQNERQEGTKVSRYAEEKARRTLRARQVHAIAPMGAFEMVHE